MEKRTVSRERKRWPLAERWWIASSGADSICTTLQRCNYGQNRWSLTVGHAHAARLCRPEGWLVSAELCPRHRGACRLQRTRAEQVDIPLADRALQLIDLRRLDLDRKSAIAERFELRRDILRHRREVASHNRLVGRRNRLIKEAETERRNAVCRQAAVPLICPKVERLIG